MQECWNKAPKERPAIKDVQSFLEPLHQKWIPLAPEDIDIGGLNLDSPESSFDDISENWTRTCHNFEHLGVV